MALELTPKVELLRKLFRKSAAKLGHICHTVDLSQKLIIACIFVARFHRGTLYTNHNALLSMPNII